MLSDIKNKLRLLNLGHHGCFYYHTQADAIETSLAFLQIGLERNERCIYLTDPSTVEKAKTVFTQAGIDVDKEAEKGTLFLTSERSYLVNGRFDKNRMIQFIDQTLQDALKAGFTGLRGVGDMVWELGSDANLRTIDEYERLVDKYLHKKKVTALCQYNMEVLSPEYLRVPLFSHNAIVSRADVCVDNHFHNCSYNFPQSSFEIMYQSLHA